MIMTSSKDDTFEVSAEDESFAGSSEEEGFAVSSEDESFPRTKRLRLGYVSNIPLSIHHTHRGGDTHKHAH